jgi:hypothetical protein
MLMLLLTMEFAKTRYAVLYISDRENSIYRRAITRAGRMLGRDAVSTILCSWSYISQQNRSWIMTDIW